MKNMEQQFSEKLTISRHETQPSSSVREYSVSIPVDLLIDILSRVPSKSIARFRCLSKFWGSILQRPNFTELFLARCPRILFTLEVNKKLLFFSSPQHPNPEENSCVVATRYNTSFPEYVPSEYKTMRCGLVLRQGYERRKVRVICNPATGEFLTLPKLLLKDKTLPNVKPKIAKICFGYDPISKQFKVLCMTSSNTHWVLTLENGKRKWRRIESEFDFRFLYHIGGEICINGVLYFGSWIQGTYAIVCFDIKSEKLSFIKIGEDIIKTWGRLPAGSTNLINYRGEIGIHVSIKRWQKLDFDLIVLEDIGNHKWTKHSYKFPSSWNNMVSENSLHIIGMTGTGEMVFAPLWLSNPFYVFYYNFERNTFTGVAIQGFEEFQPERTTSNTFRRYREKHRIDTFLDFGENMKLFK